jgi:hypothetical protein
LSFGGALLAAAQRLAQHRVDVEWLGQHGPDRLEMNRLLEAGRHDDDAAEVVDIALTEESEDAETVDARHHEVEQDGGVVAPREVLDGFESVARGVDREAVATQNERDQAADGNVVIDDQNANVFRG